jgi:hypothetical protein
VSEVDDDDDLDESPTQAAGGWFAEWKFSRSMSQKNLKKMHVVHRRASNVAHASGIVCMQLRVADCWSYGFNKMWVPLSNKMEYLHMKICWAGVVFEG